jgi:hypothetical protein
MNSINVVKPEEYFLQISSLRKHPDFKVIKEKDIEKNIIQDKVLKKGRQG